MAQMIKARDGEAYGTPAGRMDRFLLDGSATEGRISVVEHTVGPRIMAAPLHRHTLEDEYSFVLEGEARCAPRR